MAKLYLIRKNLSTYVGPYSVEQLKKFVSSIHCSQQDEVAGSCGKWVRISDTSRLKKHYAEIAKIFSSKDPLYNLSHITEKPKNSKNKVQKNAVWGLVFVGVFVLLSLPALLNSSWFNKFWFKQESHSLEISTLSGLLLSGQKAEFVQSMSQQIPKIIEMLDKNRMAFEQWLPLLRGYAFSTTGEVNGVSKSKLYGKTLPLTVQDCSLDYWKNQWLKSIPYLGDWLAGRIYLDVDWAKLLLWDAWWIRRHLDAGWIEPKNLEEGCVHIANVALESVIDKSPHFVELSKRLRLLKAVISGQINYQQEQSRIQLNSTVLSYFSCFEVSLNISELVKCKTFESKEYHDLMLQVLLYRYQINFSSFAVQQLQSGSIDKQLIIDLSKLNGLQALAPLYGFNYSDELKIIKNLASSSRLETESTHEKK